MDHIYAAEMYVMQKQRELEKITRHGWKFLAAPDRSVTGAAERTGNPATSRKAAASSLQQANCCPCT
ncbi:hypothetical protein KDJ56_00445 [Brevibacillus composti]|uniref:Uncharacterized protein n=1 Tax=Brevibacillus composti TaxID=2796470 RepID=A0A7T5EKW2_9BACL|nr:hypothetical protein [Brevibacillus composti]QQE74515.1 hypothetical protein JD108_00445 [Brevibacillus composti]QUO41597.1 hypothetical protein KDJ56_00445 [Brevibacillus composti]